MTIEQISTLSSDRRALYGLDDEEETTESTTGTVVSSTKNPEQVVNKTPIKGLPTNLLDLTLKELDYVSDRAESEHPTYATGITHIDSWTNGGLWPGTETIVAARSNAGKSAITQQICKGMLRNRDVIVLAFALDDTKSTFIARWLAAQTHVPISHVSDAKERTSTTEPLIQRAFDKFKQFAAPRLLVYGTEDIQENVDVLRDKVVETFDQVSMNSGERPQLVVLIDSPRNINFSTMPGASKMDITEYAGRRIKSMTDLTCNNVRIDPIVIVTDHLRKLQQGTKRPGMDDIKDSVGPQYDANLILMLWNDLVNAQQNGGTSDLYFLREDLNCEIPGETPRDPIIELSLLKNKMGRMSFGIGSGTALFKFYQEQSRIQGLTSDEYANYSHLIK